MRNQIIDLNTGKTYLNESMAEKDIGVSRYFIHKSLTDKIPVREQMFAYYSYGMNVNDMKEFYMQNYNMKITRSKKWQNLTKLVENQ